MAPLGRAAVGICVGNMKANGVFPVVQFLVLSRAALNSRTLKDFASIAFYSNYSFLR